MPTRIVWLTLIAVMDDSGFAQFASVANIAHRARVTLPEAEEAIRCLEAPDENSSNPSHDGRRVERVPGGWMILNADTHRNMVTRAIIQEQTRERVRRFRDRMKRTSNAPVTPSISLSEEEATTEVRTIDRSTSCTGTDSLLSSDPVVVPPSRKDGDGEKINRPTSERRQGNGANEPGSLVRDHVKHTICGGPTAKFCLTYNQYDTLAARYRGVTPKETREAINTFYAHVCAQIPEDKLAGDMVWLLRHFDAWLVTIGRVAPDPKKQKPERKSTVGAILADQAARAAKGARR